ncbi:hypothetical protein B0A50_02748 [Salinomyces thailandicus]|uniref:PH domain-containing protein n=1 Tax=Salinomyces thailandicus TaxID=706561 RepID=A0A4V5N518_9PEZI|nr:hypothetical protein B0A50_02748 [Salinomyces thailandica]
MSSLPPDSYTARRLEHCTPEHLHYTTHRAFIGPIPEGWLKNHRKQWYKKYVSKSARRAPTFIAAHPIATAGGASRHAQQPDAPDHPDVPPRPSSQSAETSAANDVATSTTSLLHGQRDGSRIGSQTHQESTQETGVASRDATPLPQRPPDLSRFDTAVNKLPRVRFHESTKQQLRTRAQRLAARGIFRSSAVKDGEILKMDRMLVRTDITRQTIGPDFDERVSASTETKPMEKWREYMVVCRKHAEDDAQSVLQFYQTRVITTRSKNVGTAKSRAKVQILLSPKRARVNLFSSLDKTLTVWTTMNSRTTIYYLRPQTGATSVEWFTFLRNALGAKRAQTLQINVPDLSVSLRLDDPFRALEASRTLAEAAEGDDDALTRAFNEERGAAGAIVSRCIDMLKQSPEWTDILKAWAKHGRVGLAWKRYDRLEWVHGAVEEKMFGTIAMAQTHDMELRPKNHYPIKAKTQKGDTLEEPAPVEGFLIRLTSQKGQERRLGKLLFKRLYFTTHNNYLLFTRPARATPPPAPKMRSQESGNVPSSQELAEQIPLTYDVSPYPLDEEKHVSWLDSQGPDSANDQRVFNEEAKTEADRNANMLLSCDGFVNMVDVRRVRQMQRGATPADDHIEEGSDVDFDMPHSEITQDHMHDDGQTSEIDDSRCFELLMKNGLVIRLQAYDQRSRNEWMRRLAQLVKYWKARVREDMNLFKFVRQQNLEALQIDERAEAMVGSFAYKWEVSQSFASPVMYHMCGIAQCRAIHLSGVLFRKPRRHTTFTRCHVILSQGHLLIFQDTLRTRSGQKLVHIHHERIASIDLKGCYIYSGLLTEEDLLYQNKTFDSNQPGHHALARIFLEDGWTSTDEDAMTTFVIWHAKSKSWFRSSHFVDDVRTKQSSDERNARREEREGKWMGKGRTKTKLERVSKLGTTGRSVVFKARSRAERDQWVSAIQVEIERLTAQEQAQGEEVRMIN